MEDKEKEKVRRDEITALLKRAKAMDEELAALTKKMLVLERVIQEMQNRLKK